MFLKTILVVEDDADAREALSELLTISGYPVASAENGLAALDQIRNWEAVPALILLDLLMPVMDGHAFLHEARKDRRMENVPIIVITADLWAQPAAADAILRKPINPKLLLRLIRRFLKPAA
jgi:CheY-like chemotaxis protein